MCIDVVAAAVLSGNRNFEGRVHPLTRANYLASPPLVVAYALAGTVSPCCFLTLVVTITGGVVMDHGPSALFTIQLDPYIFLAQKIVKIRV